MFHGLFWKVTFIYTWRVTDGLISPQVWCHVYSCMFTVAETTPFSAGCHRAVTLVPLSASSFNTLSQKPPYHLYIITIWLFVNPCTTAAATRCAAHFITCCLISPKPPGWVVARAVTKLCAQKAMKHPAPAHCNSLKPHTNNNTATSCHLAPDQATH